MAITDVIRRIYVHRESISDDDDDEYFDVEIDTIHYSVYNYFKVGDQDHSLWSRLSMKAAVPGELSADAIWQVRAEGYRLSDLRQKKRDELREEAWRLSGLTEDADCDSSVESETVKAAREAKEIVSARRLAEARAGLAEQPSVTFTGWDGKLSNDSTPRIAPVDCHVTATEAADKRRFEALFADSDNESQDIICPYAAKRPSEQASSDDDESQKKHTTLPRSASRGTDSMYLLTEDDESKAKRPFIVIPRPTGALLAILTQTQASSVPLLPDDNGALDIYLDNHALQHDRESTPTSIFRLKSLPRDHDGLSHDGDAMNRHEGALMEVPYSFETPPNRGAKRDEVILDSDFPTPVRLWSGLAQSAKGISEATDASLSLAMPNYCKKTCPRPLVFVRDLIRRGSFFNEESSLTRDDCGLRVAEYGEATGIISNMGRNNRDAKVQATCPKCHFLKERRK